MIARSFGVRSFSLSRNLKTFPPLKFGISKSSFHLCRNSSSASKSQENENNAVHQLGVIGAGQMGLGIAFVAAKVAELPVKIFDANPKQIEKSLAFLDTLIEKDIAKNRIRREQANAIKSRINPANDISAFASLDFVIEAVPENIDLKRKVFSELDQVVKPDAILATNTSSISITKIAAATKRPENIIGMHFMNPVPVMELIEIIPGLATSCDTIEKTQSLAKAMGKTCTQSQDVPGFIANRLLIPYINEAVIVLEQGIATPKDIDTTMKLGTNIPMGPLRLADFIGLDTCLAIMKVLHQEIGDTKYRPAVLLQKYVDAGWLGMKEV
ncbi:hypothetical protein G9A89_013892 [Geosiphon pyriformis]|nr:hypothetical protein G9A89_013892 [Geosiphon pyriformis]